MFIELHLEVGKQVAVNMNHVMTVERSIKRGGYTMLSFDVHEGKDYIEVLEPWAAIKAQVAGEVPFIELDLDESDPIAVNIDQIMAIRNSPRTPGYVMLMFDIVNSKNFREVTDSYASIKTKIAAVQ